VEKMLQSLDSEEGVTEEVGSPGRVKRARESRESASPAKRTPGRRSLSNGLTGPSGIVKVEESEASELLSVLNGTSGDHGMTTRR